MNTSFGQFNLNIYPILAKNTLRAWDAADEYILNHLADMHLDGQKILIINDAFGALSIALSSYYPTSQTDSFIALNSIQQNAHANDIDPQNINIQSVLSSHRHDYDCVFIKVPKTLALLEEQLHRLRPFIHEKTTIIAAGMVKHIHKSTLQLFSKILGETTTSLAKKKARLIHCHVNLQLKPKPTPYPTVYPLENTPFMMTNHANVFCRDKLDMGTRFFLKYLPKQPSYQQIIDLGCGNGILGLMAAQQHPQAHIIFTDESDMAIQSAKTTFTDSGLSNPVDFFQQDALDNLRPSADLILCNPPFHQQHVVGDAIAWRMFKQAYLTLKTQGELWVIGNRHLAYHSKLKHIFPHVEQIASNAKFILLKATRT